MCRSRSRKRSLVYSSLIYQHNPVCCQQGDTHANRNNCIPEQKNHNVARISGSRLHSRLHLRKEWKQTGCFSHTISQGDIPIFRRTEPKYSQLSLNGHLYKTDTSLKQTPTVGPCLSFLLLFDSL